MTNLDYLSKYTSYFDIGHLRSLLHGMKREELNAIAHEIVERWNSVSGTPTRYETVCAEVRNELSLRGPHIPDLDYVKGYWDFNPNRGEMLSRLTVDWLYALRHEIIVRWRDMPGVNDEYDEIYDAVRAELKSRRKTA